MYEDHFFHYERLTIPEPSAAESPERYHEKLHALQFLQLRTPATEYDDEIQREQPTQHQNTEIRWNAVLETVTTTLTTEDAWSSDPLIRGLVENTCIGVLREHPHWNTNIRLNGRLLTLLDSAIIAAREYSDDHEDLDIVSTNTLSELLNAPDSNPLLRRKAEAMLSRNADWWPQDVALRREILSRFKPPYEFQGTTYWDGPFDGLTDQDLLNIPEPWFDNEAVVEFLWEKHIRTLEEPTMRMPSDDPNVVIVKLSPENVGAYDRMGRLIGVRNIEHNARLTPLAENPRLARPDIADDIAFAFDLGMREHFARDFGFPLHTLTLREQCALIGTLREGTGEEEQRMLSIVRTFGVHGARSFLSTEFGDHFRDTIFSIAKTFSEDDAQQIFQRFSEIAALAQETAETLGKRFFAYDKAYDADAVRTELLSRAKDLLLTAESSDAASIAQKLERFKSDIVLFASMFKITQKGQGVKFEDIKDVRLESLSSEELSESDQMVMAKILTENWSKQAPELLESTLKSLQDSFENPRSRFFILRKGDSIAASVRFDEQDDGSLYAGSLNVNAIYRSIGIGEAMLQNTIDALAKDHIITAHVPAYLPVATRYVNDFGLKIVGIESETLRDGTIVHDLRLERNDAHNRHYGARPHIERFDLSQGDAALLAEVARQTSHGQVGTRYITDPLNPHLRFIAFEPAVVLSQERQAA